MPSQNHPQVSQQSQQGMSMQNQQQPIYQQQQQQQQLHQQQQQMPTNYNNGMSGMMSTAPAVSQVSLLLVY